MKPTHYTAREGGTYERWPDELDFKMEWLKLADKHSVSMGSIKIHSLTFDNPAMGYGNFPRWDCLNGWTTTIGDCVGMGLFSLLTNEGLERMGRERIVERRMNIDNLTINTPKPPPEEVH